MSYPRVLVISQASEVKRAVVTALGDSGLPAVIASTTEEARAITLRDSVSLVFCSDELPGLAIEDFIRQTTLPPLRIPVVVVLRVGEWDRCLHFLDAGALDCLAYPLNVWEMKRITQNVPGLLVPQPVHQPALRKAATAA